MAKIILTKNDNVDTPKNGAVALFVKNDNKLYLKTDNGNETILNPNNSSFKNLTDVPSSYIGNAGKTVVVNTNENGLEYKNITITTNFKDLGDVPTTYTGNAGKILSVNSNENGLEYITNTSYDNFLSLSDTPNTYFGYANKILSVNATENRIEFIDIPGNGGVTSFISLSDVPNTYQNQENKVLSVKSDASGLEFTTSLNKFTELTDVPNTYNNNAGKFVAVNNSGNGLTFVDAPTSNNTTNNSYEFIINFGASSPTSVTSLPSGWSSSISSNDVTITHNVNKPPKYVVYFGNSATYGWRMRFPTASNEMTYTEANKNTAFTIRVSTSITGADSNTQARIVVDF